MNPNKSDRIVLKKLSFLKKLSSLNDEKCDENDAVANTENGKNAKKVFRRIEMKEKNSPI